MISCSGGTVPYMQVLAKQFGISSVAVGIIFTFIYICVWISKPVFGFIADKLRDIRSILIVLIIITALTYIGVLYIPPIRNRKIEDIDLTAVCAEQRDGLMLHFLKYESSRDNDKTEYDCDLTSSSCLKNITLSGSLKIMKSLPNNTFFFKKYNTQNFSNQDCDCLKRNLSSLVCEADFYAGNSNSTKFLPEYRLVNFWIFVVLTSISVAGTKTMFVLTDAACSEILEDNFKDYGKQRLWGTIGWGVIGLATGFLNDIASYGSKFTDFSAGFYLMLSFSAIDFLLLCIYPIKKANVSENIFKDVGKIFSSLETVTFAVGVMLSGAFTGLIWTYEYWFLTDLGSSQLLLGLVTGTQCLLAEIPFFFFSGWFVKKIGHFYCLIGALGAFALRMGLYSILQNPWWVLPIELLHGVTLGVFYAAMTLYAVDYAPPGTEATMLGIFGGIYEGLGVAAGSFLGGLGFDARGDRWTFFVASMTSLSSVPVLTILYLFFKTPKTNSTVTKTDPQN